MNFVIPEYLPENIAKAVKDFISAVIKLQERDRIDQVNYFDSLAHFSTNTGLRYKTHKHQLYFYNWKSIAITHSFGFTITTGSYSISFYDDHGVSAKEWVGTEAERKETGDVWLESLGPFHDKMERRKHRVNKYQAYLHPKDHPDNMYLKNSLSEAYYLRSTIDFREYSNDKSYRSEEFYDIIIKQLNIAAEEVSRLLVE